MSYLINPVDEDQYVFLRYEGTMPPIEIVAVRYGATGLLSALHWDRLLMDITELRTIPPDLELFRLFSGLSPDLSPNARVALVIREEQAKQARLVQDIARKEGVFLACFSDVEQASTWMKGIRPHERSQTRPANSMRQPGNQKG